MRDQDTPIERIGVVLAIVILIAAALGVCPSCVTAGDLDSIRSSVSDVRAVVDEGLLDCDKLAAVERELEHTEAETERLAEQARERAWTTFDRVTAALFGLASLGFTGWGAVKATDIKRNRARLQRGEPV